MVRSASPAIRGGRASPCGTTAAVPRGSRGHVRHLTVAVAASAMVAVAAGPRASAQGLGASRGEAYEPAARPSRLGPAPGAGANPLGDSPGAGEAVLGNRLGNPGPRLVASPAEMQGPGLVRQDIGLPERSPISPVSPYGSLALPTAAEDEGPADGLTLDRAIDLLVRSNLDLLARPTRSPRPRPTS